jgi:choline kinase
MYTPEGVKWWYLRAIGQIAEHHQVETCNIEGQLWGEVDFPADHERVSQLVTEF